MIINLPDIKILSEKKGPAIYAGLPGAINAINTAFKKLHIFLSRENTGSVSQEQLQFLISTSF
jgi:hypothetical protein